MFIRLYIICGLVLSTVLSTASSNKYEERVDEQHVLVAMRLIGHELLLSSGDSTSRVLPVSKVGDQYKIGFEREFEFQPERLAAIVGDVMSDNHIASRHIVEVMSCDSNVVVYSFELGDKHHPDMLPCLSRPLPKACYEIFITILEKGEDIVISDTDGEVYAESLTSVNENQGLAKYLLWLLPLLILLIYIIKKKTKKSNSQEHVITLGSFKFDKRNMQLDYKNNRTELTSKEADLLYLLYLSVNETLEREFILNEVWGDEGDYVGRTLDVFISKLRKKLEVDANVKIVNIRGVGYKLILND